MHARVSPASSNLHRRRGEAAERLAADYLASKGIPILARNVRCKGGEIDILCLDGGLLAVVEVRQRAHAQFGGALGSVTPAKQRRIIRAARYVLQTSTQLSRRPMRFDVIGIQGLPEGRYEMRWIKDAFRAR